MLRQQAGDLGRSGPGWRKAEQTAIYLEEVADFFEHLTEMPPLVVTERSTDYVAHCMAESLDRALWLIEHDLCGGVVVDLGLLGWGTHIRNEAKQAEMNGFFARFFDGYLANLHARKDRHGVLAFDACQK